MERLHIAILGPVNSGKSTLVNALCGQEVSLVSPVAGTTTDPVRKAAELPGLGACLIIDTPGTGDGTPLGAERQRLMEKVLDQADVAVILGGGPVPEGIPAVHYDGEGIETLLRRIREVVPDREEKYLTGGLVRPGDTVLLVMPQDSEAPKGRLILPQVQVLRELLDRGCNALCCQPSGLQAALEGLREHPALVITDSQAFKSVDAILPKEVPLTSFSILLAAAKGDIRTFVEGARAIDTLRPGDRVLIAEACTHVPDTEDIGRVKIPALLRRRCGDSLQVDIAAGNDFPEDLSPYRLIVHCGACVAAPRLVRARTGKALRAGVPITNYGIALAFLQGILNRVSIP